MTNNSASRIFPLVSKKKKISLKTLCVLISLITSHHPKMQENAERKITTNKIKYVEMSHLT